MGGVSTSTVGKSHSFLGSGDSRKGRKVPRIPRARGCTCMQVNCSIWTIVEEWCNRRYGEKAEVTEGEEEEGKKDGEIRDAEMQLGQS